MVEGAHTLELATSDIIDTVTATLARTGLKPNQLTLELTESTLIDDAVSAGSAVRGTHADLLACGARPVALGALFVFGDAAARFSVSPFDGANWEANVAAIREPEDEG